MMIRFAPAMLAATMLIAGTAHAQDKPAGAVASDPAAVPADANAPAPASAPAGAGDAPPAGVAGDAAAVAPDAAPVPAASDAAPADTAPIVATLGPPPSLDTPIGRLIADPRTRAVLDRDLPGLSTDDNLGHFQQLSLRRFQPMTGGQLTPALLAKVGADLKALATDAPATLAPTAPPARGKRAKDGDGR